MPRPRRTIRPVPLEVQLPETLVARMRLLLWSTEQNRVPFGAMSQLVERAIEEFLNKRKD